MSDYLTRLVRRTLGLAPTLRVATPGIFGPAPQDDAFEPVIDATSAPVVGAPEMAPSATQPATPQAPVTPLVARDDSRVDAPFGVAPLPPASSGQDASPFETMSPRANDEPVVSPRRPLLASEYAQADERVVVRASIAEARSTAPVRSFEPLLPRREANGAATTGLVAPALATAASAVDEATVVHVSIGRVEVRAVTSPASRPERVARRTAVESERLSLSDYLRRGNGAPR